MRQQKFGYHIRRVNIARLRTSKERGGCFRTWWPNVTRTIYDIILNRSGCLAAGKRILIDTRPIVHYPPLLRSTGLRLTLTPTILNLGRLPGSSGGFHLNFKTLFAGGQASAISCYKSSWTLITCSTRLTSESVS